MTSERTVRQLEQLFREERRLLLEADFTRLGNLFSRKERMLSALDDGPLTERDLARIRGLCDRSQAMLQAAEQGLKAVQQRLSEIERGAPVGTYSATGAKSEIAKPVRTLQRRA